MITCALAFALAVAVTICVYLMGAAFSAIQSELKELGCWAKHCARTPHCNWWLISSKSGSMALLKLPNGLRGTFGVGEMPAVEDVYSCLLSSAGMPVRSVP